MNGWNFLEPFISTFSIVKWKSSMIGIDSQNFDKNGGICMWFLHIKTIFIFGNLTLGGNIIMIANKIATFAYFYIM